MGVRGAGAWNLRGWLGLSGPDLRPGLDNGRVSVRLLVDIRFATVPSCLSCHPFGRALFEGRSCMPLSEIDRALEKLLAFQPTEWKTSDQLAPEEAFAREKECELLIQLSSQFADALQGAGGYAELQRRGMRLDDLTAPATPFDNARLEVVHLLQRSPRAGIKLGNQPERTFGRLCDENLADLLFPLTVNYLLAQAELLIEHHYPSLPECAVVRHWRDELWKLSVQSEREHLWGSHLILLCHADRLPEFVDLDRHRQLHECICHELTRATRAIQDAAGHLREMVETGTPDARHSLDFRSVHWFGRDFAFTPNQAACVKVLWGAWANGTPDVGDPTLLTAADCGSDRLVDVFKHNPAWGTMIVNGSTKGSSRLQELDALESERP